MRIVNPVLQRQHFATIEAMLIHKGVCRAKPLGAALCISSSATIARIRNDFRDAYPEAVVPASEKSKRGWVRASGFTPRYLDVPAGMTQDQAAHQYLRALDIIRGTNLAEVESREPIIPIVAPIVLFNTREGMRYVFVEHARTLLQPKLNEFTTEELELLMKFPHGSRFAMRTEGRKRKLTCIGTWLEATT